MIHTPVLVMTLTLTIIGETSSVSVVSPERTMPERSPNAPPTSLCELTRPGVYKTKWHDTEMKLPTWSAKCNVLPIILFHIYMCQYPLQKSMFDRYLSYPTLAKIMSGFCIGSASKTVTLFKWRKSMTGLNVESAFVTNKEYRVMLMARSHQFFASFQLPVLPFPTLSMG